MERVAGLAGADLPLGHTPQPGGVACSRLAILFHWAQPSQPAPATSKWRADNSRYRVMILGCMSEKIITEGQFG